MPVKIQADAGEATATLTRLKSQFAGLDKAIGANIRGQFSALGSQFVGYLSIQALMSGIRTLIQYGREVNQIAGKFDPGTIEAQALTSVAQLQQEQAIAAAVGPIAEATEREKQRQAERRNFAPEGLASLAEYVSERTKRQGLENLTAVTEFAADPSLATAKTAVGTAAATAAELVPTIDPTKMNPFQEDRNIVGESIYQFGRFIEYLMGTEKASPTAAGSGDAQMVEELREIARNTRGKP